MKVAIIGAGVSGTACAHELERHGIYPDIYEIKDYIGDFETHVAAILEIHNRPIRDAVQYVKKHFEIELKPLNTVKTITHHSPGKTTSVKGNLGYFFKRGRDEDSAIGQLYSQLHKTKVIYSKKVDCKQLASKYDFVVIANGNPEYTAELGCWREWVPGVIRGAEILGKFDPNELVIWLDNSYTQKGYAYLSPFDGKRASILLFVPYISRSEMQYLWDMFLLTERIRYTFVSEFEREHFSGFTYPNKTGNIYFIGSAGGTLDPFLGFGFVNSVLQGVSAAQSIARGKDYERLIRGITKQNLMLYEFRKAFDRASNQDYDFIFKSIGLPGIRQVLYHSPLNVVNVGGSILKHKNRHDPVNKY